MICIDPYALSISNQKYILFPNIDENYAPMFLLPDGQNLRFQNGYNKETCLFRCFYLDDYHFNCGTICFHRDQFAELMRQNGHSYEPETYVTDLSVYQKFFADRKILNEQGRPVPYYALVGKGEQNFYGRPSYLLAICPAAEENRRIALVHNIGNAQNIRFCSCADLAYELSGRSSGISFPAVHPGSSQVSVHLNDQETRFITAVLNVQRQKIYPGIDAQIQTAAKRCFPKYPLNPITRDSPVR